MTNPEAGTPAPEEKSAFDNPIWNPDKPIWCHNAPFNKASIEEKCRKMYSNPDLDAELNKRYEGYRRTYSPMPEPRRKIMSSIEVLDMYKLMTGTHPIQLKRPSGKVNEDDDDAMYVPNPEMKPMPYGEGCPVPPRTANIDNEGNYIVEPET